MHSLPLESSPPLRCWSWSYTAFLWKALLLFWIEALLSILGKLWCIGLILSLIHRSSPPSGKGRDGGHGHTQPSFGELSSSFWNGREWWSWSYRAFFSKALLGWEREGMVVMVVQLSLLGKGCGCHCHTEHLSEKFSFTWKFRGWWSWSYKAFCILLHPAEAVHFEAYVCSLLYEEYCRVCVLASTLM